jgi:hypothetical protein
LQVVVVVVVVTPEVEERVDLEKAQLQPCPGRTQLLLDLAVVAHLYLQIMTLPSQQDLKKVETLLFLETIFQLPQLAAEPVQEEVHQLTLMVVLVVEVIGLKAPQEQELLGKVLLADKGWAVKGRIGLVVVVVGLVGLAERQLLESVETVAPVRALQFLAFQ